MKALRVLISSRADVTSKDGFGASPHHWAAFSNNVEGIKALCMAGCSPTDVNILGYSPFRVAASVGRVDAMRALLPYTPKEEIDLALHAAMLQGGGSAEVAVVSPTRSEPKPAIPKPCILTLRGPHKAPNLPNIQRRFEARTAARNSPEKVLYADFKRRKIRGRVHLI